MTTEIIKPFNEYDEEIKVVRMTKGIKLVSVTSSFYIGYDQLRNLNRMSAK